MARLVAEEDRAPALLADEIAREWGPTTTINDAIEGWKSNSWEDLSPSMIHRYESLWRVHIRDAIGRRRLASIGPYDVERFFRQLKAQGLSEASVRQTRAVLHRTCRLARKWSGDVLPNPITDTELPDWAISESAPIVRAPSRQKVRQLLRAAAIHPDPRVHAFVRVVAATGMRRGEACALRWSDANWDTGGQAPPHPDTLSHAFIDVRSSSGVASDIHLHSLCHACGRRCTPSGPSCGP